MRARVGDTVLRAKKGLTMHAMAFRTRAALLCTFERDVTRLRRRHVDIHVAQFLRNEGIDSKRTSSEGVCWFFRPRIASNAPSIA